MSVEDIFDLQDQTHIDQWGRDQIPDNRPESIPDQADSGDAIIAGWSTIAESGLLLSVTP
ncbi:hypothetical protein [Acidithiobacillus thiooxidans]|uniref:hypothetical protein n=1 Tax=Acidithiobacillus thiooxidans TaxID=930 RepID=UPI0011119360|nr:hypothetical protein [Acidithiobacillus thiooxidans]